MTSPAPSLFATALLLPALAGSPDAAGALSNGLGARVWNNTLANTTTAFFAQQWKAANGAFAGAYAFPKAIGTGT